MKCIQAQRLSAMSALAFAGLTGVPAAAQDFGWYLGANAGESSATVDEKRLVDDLLGAGFDTTAFKDDEGDSGFKSFGAIVSAAISRSKAGTLTWAISALRPTPIRPELCEAESRSKA